MTRVRYPSGVTFNSAQQKGDERQDPMRMPLITMVKTLSKKQSVIIGVSAGIAACKVPDLIKILRSYGLEIQVVMTESATKLIPSAIFEQSSGKRIITDIFPSGFDYREVLRKREVDHVKLSESVSLIIIIPATANIIAKIAHGIADDLLTTLVVGAGSPILICPSMNTRMWTNSIVQENILKLRKSGFNVIDPVSGALACGSIGMGRLADNSVIADKIMNILAESKKLQGQKILVTAGGTREAIDGVRFITNCGSGKMGAAIADECKQRGGEVMLLRSVNSVLPSTNVKEEIFKTSGDLENLIKKYVKDYDVLFHTAAVSDYIPEDKIENKLESRKPLILKLKPRSKILHQVKIWNPNISLIGFKAVYKKTEEEMIRIGIEKQKASNSDFIIVNDVGRDDIGFGTDDNEVYVISSIGFIKKINKSTKINIAQKLINIIFRI